MLNRHPRFKKILDCYWKNRVQPIALLWLSMLLATIVAQGTLKVLASLVPCVLDSRDGSVVPSVDKFLDGRLPLVLLGGVAVLVLTFIVAAGQAKDAREKARRLLTLERAVDEISSASTHVACGVVVLWFAANQLHLAPAAGMVCWLGSFCFYLYAQYLQDQRRALAEEEKVNDSHVEAEADRR